MTEFRGARGSNTGDDFHELWATRQAIRLLTNEDGLEALAVEGLSARDEAGSSADTWDGVDCTLYFGGMDAGTSKDVILAQLKYSAATPDAPWTIARLVGGKRRDQSVVARLAKAWRGLAKLRSRDSAPGVVFISNQPVAPEVILAFTRGGTVPPVVPRAKPKHTASAEAKLAYATGLTAGEFQEFSAAIRFEGSAGSRFAVEEQVLRAIADWTDVDVQGVVTGLRQFVRQRMRPECAGELITRQSVMVRLGTADPAALFPCPPEISLTEALVSRVPVREAAARMLSGVQYLCLHGRGGVGKTTALQEIEAALPPGSITIKYDCYGGGTYLDSNALRHRPIDAFLQLTNELAARLKLPLLLSRHQGSDYPRLFANRLKHAADALAAQQPGALIVIAIDAADNAVVAAQSREPAERSFIHDFVGISGQPENVRFVITARTGRLAQLRLTSQYQPFEIEPFSRPETGENVSRTWPAPESWIDDFHHLSGGVPRVQAYAFQVDGAHPSTALDRLRPAGKSLDEVFRQQFTAALRKSGDSKEVERLCAGLIALPRPVPLPDLAAVVESTEAHLTDVCVDLAPGIRLHNGAASFADEDFEHFVRTEGLSHLEDVQQAAASWLLSRATGDRYAALSVAGALISAGRGTDLLELVERESAPMAVADPVLRREAELQRLRLAIKVCREAGDIPRALRFVLIGAEGIKTEAALRDLLLSNPDMAANFAVETAGRLILSDPDLVKNHGPLLFQKLSVDADRGDAISVREGQRLLHAWLQARKDDHRNAEEGDYHRAWEISISDISSSVEAKFKLDGPAAALEALGSWRPWSVALEVALSLPVRLLAEGHLHEVQALAAGDQLKSSLGKLFLLLPLALTGQDVDIDLLTRGLKELTRRKLKLEEFFRGHQYESSAHGQVLDAVLTVCEVLTNKGAAAHLVDSLLESFLAPELRRIDQRHPFEATKLDFLFRAYALREARAGRTPMAVNIFEPRPEVADKSKRGRETQQAEEHDRPMRELAGAIFGIYAAIAEALVSRRTDADLANSLTSAVHRFRSEEWRISRRHGSGAVRAEAAKSLLVLLSAGYDSQVLKSFATDIHGRWRSGNSVPDERLVARLSLRQELHPSLLEDLAAGAAETRSLRIGADEKSKTLVSYARLLKPISPPDSNAVFNAAVEAASELDREAMAQIRLLDELISRGVGAFLDSRRTARQVANVVADAAIRLDGYEDFPWDESMSALARLDAPLALANAARWDDESVAKLTDTLPSLLKTALAGGSLKPSQAAAMALFLDGDYAILGQVLEQAASEKLHTVPQLAEEVAFDVVVRHGQTRNDAVVEFIEQHGFNGPWVGALLRQHRYLSLLAPEPPVSDRDEFDLTTKADNPLENHRWDRDTLLDSDRLRGAIKFLQDQGRTSRSYLPASSILRSAQHAVLPRDRVAYLSALAGVGDATLTHDTAKALLEAINAWWNSPAVRDWCRTGLPEVIVAWLPEWSSYIQYGKDALRPALKRTGLSEHGVQELVLRGIEQHVDDFGSDLIFALAGLVGGGMALPEAASLADWYAERLESRIPPEDQDQTASDALLPGDTDEGVARFLFAYLGDYDLRMRWRAAHAVRRLARTDDTTTLRALVAQYSRREEEAFRGRQLAFYWLAARLWFVVAWDRIAGERADMAGEAGPALLQIALDGSFPHLLIRSFARDACLKLVAAGRLSLNSEERSALRRVNRSPLPRSPEAKSGHRHFAHKDEGRRFKFDWMDTLPYWYEPLIRTFADVDRERFLQQVEHWIIDVWGYSGDIRDFEKERRRGRFEDRDSALTRNDHGSKPILERLNNHLEWHAMWCAAGELLKTAPLVFHDYWDDLGSQVKREKLSEPPLWSADLRGPIPLVPQNWQADPRPLEEWALAVGEPDHRLEVFPDDQPEYVLVDGESERRTGDRIETVEVRSALVAPLTGGSLVRALQTMDNSWSWLPPEGGDLDINHGPYRLLGWLRTPDEKSGIDARDPLRGSASTIQACPGRRVSEACGLLRDKGWPIRWSSKDSGMPPMFVYEAWGEQETRDERYLAGIVVAGRRLLAHKQQLQEFLCSQGLDLLLEVQVTRHGRENRRYGGEEEEKAPEGRFDRLYRLQGGGALEVAEGRLGAWTGDRPRT